MSPRPAGRHRVSVAVVSTHGVGALRSTLHRIRETTDGDVEMVVLAAQHYEDVVGYMARHYLRGDVSALALEADGRALTHCGIDTAFQLVNGDIVVRVRDDLLYTAGWLDAAVGALEADREIGMLGLVRDDEPRRRGRPPKARAPEDVDEIDPRAFAMTAEILREHAAEMRGERCDEGCRFQDRLRRLGYHIAYLPGQLRSGTAPVAGPAGGALEADLAYHPGEHEAISRLRQSYQLGEQVLSPCLACGEEEFEVLAAQIDFCESHAVPIGYTYTLRCATCRRLVFEEDHQFRCPD